MAIFISKTVGNFLMAAPKAMKTAAEKTIVCQTFSITYSPSFHYRNQINLLVSNKYILDGQFSTLSTMPTLHKDSNIYFTKNHEWIAVAGNLGTVGITNQAQKGLGNVVHARLPQVDSGVVAGAECGSLESWQSGDLMSVKVDSPLYSPVSGQVVDNNPAIEDLPALINSSAQDEGWLFKVKLTNTEELSGVFDQSSYDEFIKMQEKDY